MVQVPIKISQDMDMESRPIALLVQEASQYSSNIRIRLENKEINAKSIMGVMGLAIDLVKGSGFTVIADGKDEEAAAEGMKAFFASH